MVDTGDVEKIEIKPQVHEWRFRNTTHGPEGRGHSIIITSPKAAWSTWAVQLGTRPWS